MRLQLIGTGSIGSRCWCAVWVRRRSPGRWPAGHPMRAWWGKRSASSPGSGLLTRWTFCSGASCWRLPAYYLENLADARVRAGKHRMKAGKYIWVVALISAAFVLVAARAGESGSRQSSCYSGRRFAVSRQLLAMSWPECARRRPGTGSDFRPLGAWIERCRHLPHHHPRCARHRDAGERV